MRRRYFLLYFATVLGVAALLSAASSAALSREREDRESATVSSNDEQANSDLVHHVSFIRDGHRHEVSGRLLIEASNGMLLQADDGALFTIYEWEIQTHERTDEVFVSASHKQIGERLLAELPNGYRIHTTEHYVVCYGTSRVYAKWTSSLLERLHGAFTRYWSRKGFDLHEPEFPLIAMVFPDRQSYERAAAEQVGGIASGVVGYYSLHSNRVNMYDLTGMESLRGPGNRRGSLKEISLMLSQPGAVPLVSTIVHEATHQIAFNCGLQTRLADIPLWLCEGLAVVFEAPDASSSKGWRGIGKVNYERLATFRRNQANWNSSHMMSLLATNDRFRHPRTAPDAYADAWALNFYLIKYRPKQYASYLKMLAAKPPIKEDTPDRRLAEFREHFGEIRELERDFLKQMAKVK